VGDSDHTRAGNINRIDGLMVECQRFAGVMLGAAAAVPSQFLLHKVWMKYPSKEALAQRLSLEIAKD